MKKFSKIETLRLPEEVKFSAISEVTSGILKQHGR
jgi:hypothetical protein